MLANTCRDLQTHVKPWNVNGKMTNVFFIEWAGFYNFEKNEQDVNTISQQSILFYNM